MPKYIVFVLLLLFLGGLFFAFKTYYDFKDKSGMVNNLPGTQPTPLNSIEKQEFPAVSTIATGLEIPWALAFLPDKSILVTERPGRLRLIDSKGILLPKPVATISDVKPIGEGGLLGIALHPDFSRNHYIYLYYTYSGSEDVLNKVVRMTFQNNELTDEKIIIDNIPGSSNHDGGRIKFGPDKYLYITTGDAQNPSLAQDENSLAGKILRVKDEGQVEVYSYGHRNPQGIAWDSKGQLWEVEHGNSATDEINFITKDNNYGWPEFFGDKMAYGPLPPVLHSGQNTWAPAGAAILNDSLFFGGLRGQALFEYNIQTKQLKSHFKSQFGRIRDVVLGPDNMLYITTSNRDGRGTPSPDDDKIIIINPNEL